jgi:hypothetical protein
VGVGVEDVVEGQRERRRNEGIVEKRGMRSEDIGIC